MRRPIKIPVLWYCELSIDGTKRISGKIRVGQNFPETNLLSENGNLSKIFKCLVQLFCGGKPWGRAQGHPALSSPVGLWVQWSKFFPGRRLDLERCLSNFLSMDLEASGSLKLWAFYTSILASSWAHEPLSLIAHTSCMVTHDLASESRVNQLHLLMGKSGIKEVEESYLCPSVTP